MTQDEVIEMARDAGAYEDFAFKDEYFDMSRQALERFANLVAAKEREACAKVCETAREAIWEYYEEHLKAASCNVCTNLATAIRARKQA